MLQGPNSTAYSATHVWVTHRAVPALCEKSAVLDPFSPIAKVTAVTTVLPYAGLPPCISYALVQATVGIGTV